jgi:pimeloyl-ACP methyl ester carboxylesterase
MARRLAIFVTAILTSTLLAAAMAWYDWFDPNLADVSIRPPMVVDEGDGFVFTQGCVPVPGDNGVSCSNAPEVDWRQHLTALRVTLGMTETRFADWYPTHVTFPRARNASPAPVAEAVGTLSRKTRRVFLIGHSAGALATANYLLTLRTTGVPPPYVGGAYLIDAPLMPSSAVQSVGAAWAQFNEQARLEGLGTWAKANHIDLLIISYYDDWAVNPLRPVADVPFLLLSSNPLFPSGPWELWRKHQNLMMDFQAVSELHARLFTRDALQ